MSELVVGFFVKGVLHKMKIFCLFWCLHPKDSNARILLSLVKAVLKNKAPQLIFVMYCMSLGVIRLPLHFGNFLFGDSIGGKFILKLIMSKSNFYFFRMDLDIHQEEVEDWLNPMCYSWLQKYYFDLIPAQLIRKYLLTTNTKLPQVMMLNFNSLYFLYGFFKM